MGTDIDYINAHESGAPLGDRAETKAIMSTLALRNSWLPPGPNLEVPSDDSQQLLRPRRDQCEPRIPTHWRRG
jgi:3-oxoacyl-(acyl-carrier-protein) synthase